MTDDEFWSLVDRTRAMAGGAPSRQFELVKRSLEALPEDEILSFADMHLRFANAAFAWDLWAAAFAIGGGCDDDGFDAFCDWLVSRGERVYRAALADPASLADVFTAGAADDGRERAYQTPIFWNAAWAAYEARTGREIAAVPPAEADRRAPVPAGAPWEVEEPDLRFPRLAALRNSLPGLALARGVPRVLFSIDDFWATIGEANAACPPPDPLDAAAAWLEYEIGTLVEEPILSFAWRFGVAVERIERSPVLRAVAARGSAGGESRSTELASWLVVAGRETYEAALSDPASLEATLDRLVRRGIRSEPPRTFRDLPVRAWSERTGRAADMMPRRRT